MITKTYKIKTDYALGILLYLEKVHAIIAVPEKKIATIKTKLSDSIVGSISHKEASKIQAQLKQMRNEWERDIS